MATFKLNLASFIIYAPSWFEMWSNNCLSLTNDHLTFKRSLPQLVYDEIVCVILESFEAKSLISPILSKVAIHGVILKRTVQWCLHDHQKSYHLHLGNGSHGSYQDVDIDLSRLPVLIAGPLSLVVVLEETLQDVGDVWAHGLGQAVGAGAGPGLSGGVQVHRLGEAVNKDHSGAGVRTRHCREQSVLIIGGY